MRENFKKDIIMTKEDIDDFKTVNKCYICSKKYTKDDTKVRDHCHITGKYRGLAHDYCNLNLKINPEDNKIPIIFHDLRGYDSHFIMQEIGEITKKYKYKNKKGEEKQMDINAIPNNMENISHSCWGNI